MYKVVIFVIWNLYFFYEKIKNYKNYKKIQNKNIGCFDISAALLSDFCF